MELIGAAPSGNVDHRAGGLAIFRAIRIAQHLEFGDRVDRWIDQDRTIRAHVVVVGSVDQEQVICRRIPVNREIDASQQSFVLGIEIICRRDARLELRKLPREETRRRVLKRFQLTDQIDAFDRLYRSVFTDDSPKAKEWPAKKAEEVVLELGS